MKTKLTKAVLLLAIVAIAILCFVACGNTKTFSVTVMDGETEIATLSVADGAAFDYSGKVSKEGYVLKGLFYDSEFKQAFNKDSEITGDLLLYAQFEKVTYTITVKSNGGSEVAPVTVAPGATYTLPEPTREGYTFTGYTYIDDDDRDQPFPLTGTYNIDGNTRVYAQWSINSYTVTLNDGVSATPTKLTVEYGQKAVFPVDPVKLGNTFLGWFAEGATAAFDKTAAITENVTLTARFSVNSYTINVATTGSAVDPITVAFGADYTVPASSKTGYTFLGYTYVDDNQEVQDFSLTGKYVWARNLRITAQWALETRTVTLNDGISDAPTVLTVEYGKAANFPANPAKIGHTFLGWFAEGATAAFDKTAAITENVTLTADYRKNTYTITASNYDFNDTVEYGDTYTLPTQEAVLTAKAGVWSEFKGWLVNGQIVDTTGKYNWATDIIITADYVRDPMYLKSTVSFFDGTRLMASFAIDDGATVATELATINTTKLGYTFVKWHEENKDAEFDDSTVINADLSLYATYDPNSYTITILPDGGEGETVYDVTYDGEYTLVALTKRGYTFDKYLDNEKHEFSLTGTYTIASDIVLTATYSRNTVMVTFLNEDESLYRNKEIYQYQTITDAAIDAPSKTGYTFLHWSTVKNGGDYGATTEIEKERSLYPVYKANDYVITLDFGGSTQLIPVVFDGDYALPVLPKKDGYIFDKYQLDGEDFDATGKYTYPMGITVSILWKQDNSLFVEEETYFKERTTTADPFTYVFLTGITYDFGDAEISTEDGYEFISLRSVNSTNDHFKAEHVTAGSGTFSLTVTPNGGSPKTIRARIVESVNTFGAGSNYSNMLSTVADSALFIITTTKSNYVMDVGNENFIPDVAVKNYGKEVITLSAANMIVTVDGTDVTASSLSGNALNLSESLRGDAERVITLAPKYALTRDNIDTVSFKVRVNDGVNVYNNADLKLAYKDVNVQKINILRNIEARLDASDYDLSYGGHGYQIGSIDLYACDNYKSDDSQPVKTIEVDTGTPINDFQHSVYVRSTARKDDNLVINGNYFLIDGGKLPYIDNEHDHYGAGGSEYAQDGPYRLANTQLGIFLYRCVEEDASGGINRKFNDGNVTMNNLRIESNYIPEYASYVQLFQGDRDEKPLLKMSASYIGVVVRGGTMNMTNVSISEAEMGFMLHGEVSGYDVPGVDEYSTVLGHKQENEDQACKLNFDKSMINFSWANSIYAFDLCEINLTNSKIGSSCGAAISVDDRPYVRDGGSGATNPHGFSDLNTELNIDISTALSINNWVTGAEAWFVAYAMGPTAAGAITTIETTASKMRMTIDNPETADPDMNFVILVRPVDKNSSAWNEDIGGKPGLDINLIAPSELSSAIGGIVFTYENDAERDLAQPVADAMVFLSKYDDTPEKFFQYCDDNGLDPTEANQQVYTEELTANYTIALTQFNSIGSFLKGEMDTAMGHMILMLPVKFKG